MPATRRAPLIAATAGVIGVAVILLVAADPASHRASPAASLPLQAASTTPAEVDASGFTYDQDKALLAPAYGALPSVGEVRTQAGTGAPIKRIAKGGLVVYSRYTPVSIDNKLIVIHGENSTSARIEELATGKVVRELPDIGEENEIRWHYGADAPSRFYYVRGMEFRQRDAITGKDALVRDFTPQWPTGSQLFTDVEGDSSNDSRYWCWMVRREVDEGPYPVEQLVSYDRVTDTLHTADAAKLGRADLGRPNTIEASPDGGACVIHWGAGEGRPQAWKRDFSAKIRDVAVDETHTGWILDSAGDSWFVSQNNQSDWIEAVNLRTGQVRKLVYHGDIGWDNGMHFSKSYVMRDYVLLSTCSATNAIWGENQLVMLGLDGRILRIAHTHNAYPGDEPYRNEAAAAMSFDGRGIYWTSNWGDGTRTRDVYGIELPAEWWTRRR
ncbi:hypothetical protein DT603_04955 [Pseudoxanthomonas gei]|uniref:WD40 repeat domain-containing protein n=1 Tax=Pseudoxanthomonas gei TaxID=1383030 RepID=A0ABX0A9I2_9GAMM|nr:hypothetical protein [Pseudoxanthomonas gei]NDK38188.1 hypothetical protein [Pseudoxanthomonas gei]